MITLFGPGKNHGLYTSGNSKQFGPKKTIVLTVMTILMPQVVYLIVVY